MGERPIAVVTGSTRGIGLVLARSFLAEWCSVVVNGRDERAVAAAVASLTEGHPERVHGVTADVSAADGADALWRGAVGRFGRVDVWVNNAGLGATQVPFREQRAADVDALARVNLLGTIHGTHVAVRGMTAQPGGGQVFNLEGFGSRFGMMRTGMSVYGATKTAVLYFSRSVAREQAGTPVLVGTLVPGVVVTDMLVSQFDGVRREVWEKARLLYNKVGDTADRVAPVLVRGMLANRRNGATVAYLSGLRFLLRAILPSRRDLFASGRQPQLAP